MSTDAPRTASIEGTAGLGGLGRGLAADGELHDERGTAVPRRVHADRPTVLLRDGVRDRQPQTRTRADLLRREKRVENLALDIRGHARAVVAHLERHGVVPGVVPCADSERAAVVGGAHGLLGVDDQVQQHLLDLMGVGEDLRQGRGQRGHDLDIGGLLLVSAEREGFGDHLVDVDHRARRLPLPRERQQVADDPGRTVRFAENDVHASPGLVIQRFLGQALRPAQDRGERVVQLMRDA